MHQIASHDVYFLKIFWGSMPPDPPRRHVQNGLTNQNWLAPGLCKGAALAVDCKPISSSILKHLILLLHLLRATCTAGKYVPPAEKILWLRAVNINHESCMRR